MNPALAAAVRRHSLAWLVAANAVGVLLAHGLPDGQTGARGRTTGSAAWSGGWLIGGFTWLAGRVSGKLFLDGVSPAREVWALAGTVLGVVLGLQAWRRGGIQIWLWILLLALGAIPALLYWAADPAVDPAVNPHSGGATGASLLGSTLGSSRSSVCCRGGCDWPQPARPIGRPWQPVGLAADRPLSRPETNASASARGAFRAPRWRRRATASSRGVTP